MSARIILINPPVSDRKSWVREGRCQQWDIWGAAFPPLSLALISTQLRKADMETLIMDPGPAGQSPEDVIQESRDFRPQAAVLATTTPTLQSDLGWFAVELKKVIPDLKLVVIGIHVSVLPREVLERFTAVDYVIIGEPEISTRDLLVSILGDGGSSVQVVKGVAYRDEARAVVVNPPREFLEDLDSLGLPDWQGISFHNYTLPILRRPFSLIVFSRGCPFRCKFCATQVYNGSRIRRRSIESLIGEIRLNMSFGVRDFLFWTEQMTSDKQFLSDFLDRLCAEGLHKQIKWVCNSRVDSVDEDLLARMSAAGCWQIAFGLEFGDDRILGLANKGGRSSTEQGRAAVEMADRAGLIADGHFIMGYPGEDAGSLQKTIDFARSIPLTFAHFYSAVPFPGSQLYEDAKANGWIAPEHWNEVNQDACCLNTPELDSETVNAYIQKAYRRFYLRLRIICRILRIPRTAKEYWNLAKTCSKMFRVLR